MIAKVIPHHRKSTAPPKAPPFHRRIAYTCRKAAEITVVNLAGGWRDAARQMHATATLAPRCHQPAYHLVLSWAAMDAPSPPAMMAAARDLLHRIGAAAHQAVIARHMDRPHPHLHIVLNRINPLTGKRLALRHDYALLEKACRQIEARFGWPPDRGRFDTVQAGEKLTLIPKAAMHWQQKTRLRAKGIRPDGRSVRGPELRLGWPALRDAIAPKALLQIAKDLAQAPAWQAVHDLLRRHSLRYLHMRAGGQIAHNQLDWAMPACHLGSACALPQLERRLGPYQPDLKTITDPTATLPFAAFMDGLKPALTMVTDSVIRRAADKQARANLVKTLAQETTFVRDRLGDSRATFAIALRRVRADLHRHVLRAWDQDHPLPPTAMDVVEAAYPALALRRRYRMLFRGAPLRDAEGNLPDPTAIRQALAFAQHHSPRKDDAGPAPLSGL